MMNERLENILIYLKHGITNAVSGLNSKIQWVKYTARGFRSQQDIITAVTAVTAVGMCAWSRRARS